MGNNFYKILGSVFMIASGLMYTAERIVDKLSSAMIAAQYAKNGTLINIPIRSNGFNFFVWFFLFVGFLLLAYGFPKRR
jgi:hypothetical protein